MGKIVNLNQYRKQQRRNAEEREAEQNRRKFGESRSEREKTKAELVRRNAELDNSKLN